jgi:hypothetical protein
VIRNKNSSNHREVGDATNGFATGGASSFVARIVQTGQGALRVTLASERGSAATWQNENCKLQKSNWPNDVGDLASQFSFCILQFAMTAWL